MPEPTDRDREMAQEWLAPYKWAGANPISIERLAEKLAAVRAEERERCAQIAEDLRGPAGASHVVDELRARIAVRIREGGDVG